MPTNLLYTLLTVTAVALLARYVLLPVYRNSTKPTPGRAAHLARMTGHPSAGAPRLRSSEERMQLAVELAAELKVAGMITAHLSRSHAVKARGEDGDYTLIVGPTLITVTYSTNAGQQQLLRTPVPFRAATAVLSHAGMTASA